MDRMRMRSDDTAIAVNVMMKAGDIAWVRVEFPHKWCPALVLSSSHLAIHVTFSFFPNDAVSPCSYFFLPSPSHVLPFELHFSSLVSHVSPSHAPLLHSALRLFGQRLLAAFRCPCLMPFTRAPAHSRWAPDGPHFDPVGLFGFVLDAAVSPRLHPPRFARAVRFVAQLHAFRTYSSMHRKKLYQETQYTGDNVKLLPSSSSGQMMQSVTQKSVALEPKEKCQIISKNGEKNIAIGAIRRLNSSVSDCEGNPKYSYKNKLMFISENLRHSVSLDPFYMVPERLKSERQSLLGFKYTSDQGLVDICFGNSFTMSETLISVPLNFKIHLSNYINKSKDNALELCCRLPDAETTIFPNSKRRRLDKPASCHVLSEIGEVQESDRDAYVSKHARTLISHIKFEPEGGIQKEHQSSTCFWETTTNLTDEVQKVDLKRSGNCKSLSNPLLCFHSTKCEVDVSAATVKGMLGSDSPVYQERLQMSCNDDTTPVESKISARIALSSGDHLVEGKDCYEGVASCFIFNSKVGQPSNIEVPFSPKSLYMKFPRNFNLPSKEELIRKFSVFGTVDSCRTRVSCYTGSAQVAFLQELDTVAAYQYAKRKAWFGDANVRFWLDPFEHKRGFKCFAHVPPPASKQIEPPLKLCLRNSSSSRQDNSNKYFSRKYTVPSASKQIGPPLKSCLKNSNSLRQENNRKHCSLRYTAPPTSKQVEPPLKSCQKTSNSNPRRQENRKKHCSVRYTAPSSSRQIGPPLKSCLKNSNSLRQENRKKHRRVRFTIET